MKRTKAFDNDLTNIHQLNVLRGLASFRVTMVCMNTVLKVKLKNEY